VDCFCLYLCSPTPTTTRSQTCAYVTRLAVNVPGVTSMGHEVHEGHTKKRAVRHIHVKSSGVNLSQNVKSVDLHVGVAKDFSFMGFEGSSVDSWFRCSERTQCLHLQVARGHTSSGKIPVL
jgi:hypothetical protein